MVELSKPGVAQNSVIMLMAQVVVKFLGFFLQFTPPGYLESINSDSMALL